jgi:hypothetical protein
MNIASHNWLVLGSESPMLKKGRIKIHSEEDAVFFQEKLMIARLNLWKKSILRIEIHQNCLKNQKTWN